MVVCTYWIREVIRKVKALPAFTSGEVSGGERGQAESGFTGGMFVSALSCCGGESTRGLDVFILRFGAANKCVFVCVVSGWSLDLEHGDVRRPDDHGRDAVHRIHIQPLCHQRGQVCVRPRG